MDKGRPENFFVASFYTESQGKVKAIILDFTADFGKCSSGFYDLSWGRAIPVSMACLWKGEMREESQEEKRKTERHFASESTSEDFILGYHFLSPNTPFLQKRIMLQVQKGYILSATNPQMPDL